MVAHPASEFLAVATEVRGLVHARDETIERDEQVCGKLSHTEFPFIDLLSPSASDANAAPPKSRRTQKLIHMPKPDILAPVTNSRNSSADGVRVGAFGLGEG
jgi:hypothetical protein